MKRLLPQIFVPIIVLAVILQWYQIIYRCYLFVSDSGYALGMNHIGDGEFACVYVANVFVFLCGLISYRLIRGESRWLILFVRIAILANAAAFIAWFIMHRTGVLVEYSEFIRNSKMGRWK